MSLTLEQYDEYLDSRADLIWPAAPDVHRTKSKPHLKRLTRVKAITWNVYGTLLSIAGGEFLREHPQKFIMDLALDKTIQEFKMWKSMSRKPGHPAEYMRVMIGNVVDELSFQVDKGERYPEISVERIWEGIVKKLLQNEYVLETARYGTLEEFSLKIAYFFHRSLQGIGAQQSAGETIQWLKNQQYWQGLLADGQAFTSLQLKKCLHEQNPDCYFDLCIPPYARVLSYSVRSKKPSDRLYKEMVARLSKSGISPDETLHIGNDLANDLGPARKHGFLTCLYTGDSSSLKASPEMIADKALRPDVMITELSQVIEMLAQ